MTIWLVIVWILFFFARDSLYSVLSEGIYLSFSTLMRRCLGMMMPRTSTGAIFRVQWLYVELKTFHIYIYCMFFVFRFFFLMEDICPWYHFFMSAPASRRFTLDGLDQDWRVDEFVDHLRVHGVNLCNNMYIKRMSVVLYLMCDLHLNLQKLTSHVGATGGWRLSRSATTPKRFLGFLKTNTYLFFLSHFIEETSVFIHI